MHLLAAELQVQQRQSLDKRPFLLINYSLQFRVRLFLHAFEQPLLAQKTWKVAEDKSQRTSNQATDDRTDHNEPMTDGGTEKNSQDCSANIQHREQGKPGGHTGKPNQWVLRIPGASLLSGRVQAIAGGSSFNCSSLTICSNMDLDTTTSLASF